MGLHQPLRLSLRLPLRRGGLGLRGAATPAGQVSAKGLLRELVRLGAENGLHTIVGLVTEENAASRGLAEKVGFRRVGTLEEVGYKFDRWLDVIIYQYRYES